MRRHSAQNMGRNGAHSRTIFHNCAGTVPMDFAQQSVDEKAGTGDEGAQHFWMLKEILGKQQGFFAAGRFRGHSYARKWFIPLQQSEINDTRLFSQMQRKLNGKLL